MWALRPQTSSSRNDSSSPARLTAFALSSRSLGTFCLQFSSIVRNEKGCSGAPAPKSAQHAAVAGPNATIPAAAPATAPSGRANAVGSHGRVLPELVLAFSASLRGTV